MKNFIPIRLNTLKSNRPFGFTLLIKINDNFIKYINPEDDIEQHRLDRLKDKGVKKVYIDTSDEKKYHLYLDGLLEKMGTNELGAETKAMVLAGSTANAMEKVYSNPDDQVAYNHTQKAASMLVSATGATPEILKEMFNIEADDDVSINCALTTSTTAISLGRKLGLKPHELETVGLAALLCDISLPMLMQGHQIFFTRDISEFGAEESSVYRSHPIRSAEILQNKEFSSPELLSIIANHEEKINGKGFPKGITKLSTLEKIVALSNRYSILTLGMKMGQEKALKELILKDVGAYELNMINALKDMIGKK